MSEDHTKELWRYDIQYGPEGEANYAWVYDASGNMVATMRTHHAMEVTRIMNAQKLISGSIDKASLAEAVRKTAKLRIEDVGGRKERPAETVQSCLNRGYVGLGSDEGLSYILRHAIKYYLSAKCAEVK